MGLPEENPPYIFYLKAHLLSLSNRVYFAHSFNVHHRQRSSWQLSTACAESLNPREFIQ